MDPNDRIRIREVRTLSADWYVLKKTTFDYQLADGSWKTLSRETYDRGNGAVILPCNPRRGTVLLTRQFRLPAYVNGCPDGMLVEACAGLLERDSPEAAIRREAREELGVEVTAVRPVLACYMSPGSVTEKLSFFVAEYHDSPPAAAGNLAEGEQTEVVELTLDEAWRQVGSGLIQDGKTILLLLLAKLHGWLEPPVPG